jgi:hypothetical protein
MPIQIKIGPLTGTAATLADPQKLERAVRLLLEAEKPEGYEGWSNQQALDWAAEWMARTARREALAILRAQAFDQAAASVEGTTEI